MFSKLLTRKSQLVIALTILFGLLYGCQNGNQSLDSYSTDSEKYEWLLSKSNSDNYVIVSSLDTISMVKSEEDNKFKKCRTRCVVIERKQPREINLIHFTNNDTIVRYNDKIALIVFDVEEIKYHDTIVVDKKYMTSNFTFYSDHKKQEEKDAVFFDSYTMLEIPIYKSEDGGVYLDFVFGIPKTKRLYGSSLIFYSAGYESICNNMTNTLYGE